MHKQMKKLNEVEIFVKMLEHSEEVFRIIPVDTETHVRFQERNIMFIFDKDGRFLRIKSLK
jgi:hypothetical protein